MVSKEKRSNLRLLGASLGLLSALAGGTALAELKVTGAGKDARMAPDQFPAEHQERLKLFEAKCGKCHDLDRPITAVKTGKTPISAGPFDDDGIKGYVTKMMRKPNSGVEQSDAKEIIILLRFARTLVGGLNQMKKVPAAFLFLLATSPALMGAKCVEYDERFAVVGDEGADDAGAADDSDGGADDSAGGAAAFGPGKACGQPGMALLTVKDRQFSIDCGCAETAGAICTVPMGTKVRWSFVDSEEHVVSGGPEIGKSAEKLVGVHEATFKAAGSYRYSCSIHANMKGYSIVVK